MENFTIRRSFLLPLGLLLILCLLLLAVVLAQGQPKAKVIILGVLIVPIAGLFAESLFRRVHFDEVALTVYKPLRQKSLLFADVTAVDTVQVRKRVFLTLSTEDDFVILSNAYADFPGLVAALLSRVPPAAISAETKTMAADPPTKSADIVSCWAAVVLLVLLLIRQFA